MALSGSVALAMDDKMKVGFIYVGPKNDGGWTQRHDIGRMAVEEQFGDKVETVFVESVPEADSERAIERMARDGADMIFTTSFGFMDPTLEVAKKFPDVKFEHATGYKRADNVATYSSRFYEGRYVLGQIAAAQSETGEAGYIASFPIPEVIRGINAFILGAQTVDPDFKLKIVWVNTWFDPAKEADAAKALFDQGVDIITQHTDSPAPLQIAEERGLQGFGQANDQIAFGPNAQLTAIIDDWDPYYVSRVQAAMDGTWASGDMWGGMDTGMVRMADLTNMPDDVKARAEATIAAITSGELHPFMGPITKQNGEVVGEEGKPLDDGVLATMNYYVKGVEGDVPG
ncbi:MAG: BMP family ABC transporter substrate-binding protein [Pseudomonadota bacterium]